MRAITSSSGAITQTYQTDEFGVASLVQGTSTQPFGYTGEQNDAESSFVFLRARYYAPSLGRFLGQDPVLGSVYDPLSLNRFAYATNDPVTLNDPSGRSPDAGDEPMYPDPGSESGSSLGQPTWYTPAAVSDILADSYNEEIGADLQALAWAYRRSIRGQVNRLYGRHPRNVAVAVYYIDDGSGALGAVSGQYDPAGSATIPPTRRFTTFPVGGYDRTYDSEVKILETLASNLSPDATGAVKLYSDPFDYCASCTDVVRQFTAAYPGISVTLYWRSY